MEKQSRARSITIAILGILVFLLLQPIQTVTGAQSNSTITLTVNVTNKTIIDIQPKALSWYNVEPGSEATSTAEAINTITIENMGSVNITQVWFNSSFPSSRPFGTADPNAYDPGNFVVITDNTGSGDYNYVNRVEYPEPPLGYLLMDNSNYFHSRFRNGSKEYFFVVENTSGCGAGVTLKIGNQPHTNATTGTTDFTSTGSDYVSYTLQGPYAGSGGVWSGSWGVVNVTINGTDQYCFAIKTDCSMAVFTRWNKDAPGLYQGGTGPCPNIPDYWLDTGAGDQPIVPGAWKEAGIHLRIPYGTVMGNLPPGRLIVYAQSPS